MAISKWSSQNQRQHQNKSQARPKKDTGSIEGDEKNWLDCDLEVCALIPISHANGSAPGRLLNTSIVKDQNTGPRSIEFVAADSGA